MCQGKGAASSIFRRRSVWLKPLHSIHIKVKSQKHIHNMATIFYLYDCISLIRPTISTPHTGCKLISHIEENKGMVAMLLVMHQSFVAPAPSGPRNSGAFNFSIFKALLKALHCRSKFVVKSPLKAPAPGG